MQKKIPVSRARERRENGESYHCTRIISDNVESTTAASRT